MQRFAPVFPLAVLALAGPASAQQAPSSSVTLFGVVDASVSRYSVGRRSGPNGIVAGRHQTVLANGALNASRLGFRGTEDLGGGLSVGFWLESPLGNDSGSTQTRPLDFSRRSTVSLSGPFGEIRLGRDMVPTDWNDLQYSVFGPQSVGATLVLQAAGRNLTGRPFLPGDGNAVRASNSLGYFLPKHLGGIHGQVMYAFHENVRSAPALAGLPAGTGSTRGRYVGARFGYARGPVDVALAVADSTLGNLAGTLAPPYGFAQWAAAYDARVRTASLGGSYDFGAVKLVGQVSRVRTRFEQPDLLNPANGRLRVGASDTAENRGWSLGAVVPVGAGQIMASYSRLAVRLPAVAGVLPQQPASAKLAVGYVHHLSKRTALYATAARVRNRNGAALAAGGVGNAETPMAGVSNASASGYDLGIRHAF